jgi:hypothetical protein
VRILFIIAFSLMWSAVPSGLAPVGSARADDRPPEIFSNASVLGYLFGEWRAVAMIWPKGERYPFADAGHLIGMRVSIDVDGFAVTGASEIPFRCDLNGFFWSGGNSGRDFTYGDQLPERLRFSASHYNSVFIGCQPDTSLTQEVRRLRVSGFGIFIGDDRYTLIFGLENGPEYILEPIDRDEDLDKHLISLFGMPDISQFLGQWNVTDFIDSFSWPRERSIVPFDIVGTQIYVDENGFVLVGKTGERHRCDINNMSWQGEFKAASEEYIRYTSSYEEFSFPVMTKLEVRINCHNDALDEDTQLGDLPQTTFTIYFSEQEPLITYYPEGGPEFILEKINLSPN